MPKVIDSTSLGCGFAAGLHLGIWKNEKEIEALVELKGDMNPNLERKKVFDQKYKKWDSMINYLMKQPDS